MGPIRGYGDFRNVPGHLGREHVDVARLQLQEMQAHELGTKVGREVDAFAVPRVPGPANGDGEAFVQQWPQGSRGELELVKVCLGRRDVLDQQQAVVGRREVHRAPASVRGFQRHLDPSG